MAGQSNGVEALKAGTNVSIDDTTTAGTLTIAGPTLGDNPNGDYSLIQDTVGPDYTLRKLVAGTNVTIDDTTTAGALRIALIDSPSVTTLTATSQVATDGLHPHTAGQPIYAHGALDLQNTYDCTPLTPPHPLPCSHPS